MPHQLHVPRLLFSSRVVTSIPRSSLDVLSPGDVPQPATMLRWKFCEVQNRSPRGGSDTVCVCGGPLLGGSGKAAGSLRLTRVAVRTVGTHTIVILMDSNQPRHQSRLRGRCLRIRAPESPASFCNFPGFAEVSAVRIHPHFFLYITNIGL